LPAVTLTPTATPKHSRTAQESALVLSDLSQDWSAPVLSDLSQAVTLTPTETQKHSPKARESARVLSDRSQDWAAPVPSELSQAETQKHSRKDQKLLSDRSQLLFYEGGVWTATVCSKDLAAHEWNDWAGDREDWNEGEASVG
jgi:hypothetical protein